MRRFLLAIWMIGSLATQARSDQEDRQAIDILSPEWVLWIRNETPDTEKAILDQNSDYFQDALQHLINRETNQPVNWVLLKQRTAVYQSEYARLSREHIVFSKPEAFTISSADDPEYATPCPVKDVVVWVHSLGDCQTTQPLLRDCRNYERGHCYYLRLPKPLQVGKHYQITRSDGVSIAWNTLESITPAIKTNQIGYLPKATKKYAYLGAWVPDRDSVDFSMFKKFELREAKTGKSVFQGDIRKRSDVQWKPEKQMEKSGASYCGETVWEMDFSAFHDTGRYYISVPGLGRSHDMEFSPQVYGEPFFVQARGFYHQRCGTPLEKPWTAWERKACHTAPVHPCGLPGNGGNAWLGPDGKPFKEIKNIDFEVIKATADRSDKPLDITGGWHDAADYDRRQSHHFAIWDMLGAYEIHPSAFTDGQLNLPESGNGIPDLLDEVHWGLKIWMKAQLPSGAVPGRVEETSHPNHAGMPDCDLDEWFVGRPTCGSTFAFAASAAWFSRLCAPFDKALAEDLKSRAIRAYAWATAHANESQEWSATIRDSKNQSPIHLTWQEKPGDWAFEALLASLELSRVTGDPIYLSSALDDYAPHAIRFFKSWPNYNSQLWPMYALATTLGVPEDTKQKAAAELIRLADERANFVDSNPYRHPWNPAKSRRWGNALPATTARYLVLAYQLTKNPRYRSAMELSADFHLGCNPLGLSHTTGLGYRFPSAVQDAETRADGLFEPVPGLTPYGIISMPHSAVEEVFRIKCANPRTKESAHTVSFLPDGFSGEDPPVPLWRRISPNSRSDPLNNEFTLQETLSPAVLLFAALLEPGWMPDEALKCRTPRSASQLSEMWFRTP